MTKKDLIEIALKIFGFYLLIGTLDYFVGLTMLIGDVFAQDKGDKPLAIYISARTFGLVIYAIASYLLILKTDKVINKLKIKNTDRDAAWNINKEDLIEILFATAGIIIIVFSIPEFFRVLSYIDIGTLAEKFYKYFFFLNLLIPLVKFLIGATLLLGALRIVNIKKKLKTLGMTYNLAPIGLTILVIGAVVLILWLMLLGLSLNKNYPPHYRGFAIR